MSESRAVTTEDARNAVKQINDIVARLPAGAEKAEYLRLIERANDYINKNNLPGLAELLNGIVRTSQTKLDTTSDESMEIRKIAGDFRQRIRNAPKEKEPEGYEKVITEINTTEAMFRAQVSNLAHNLDIIEKNPRVAENVELMKEINNLRQAIQEFQAGKFDVVKKTSDGKFEIDLEALQIYAAQLERLNIMANHVMRSEHSPALKQAENAEGVRQQMRGIDLTTTLIEPTNRVSKLEVLLKDLMKKNKDNNVINVSQALDVVRDAATNVNNVKGEMTSFAFQRLATYDEKRIGSAHRKEKAEVLALVQRMKQDTNTSEREQRVELRDALSRQLNAITANRKRGQKEGRYSKLLGGMIEKLNQDIQLDNARALSGDQKAIAENWDKFTNAKYSEQFMKDIAPRMTEREIFELAGALMKHHLESDNKHDSILRANGHLSGMLYKELAQRMGYKPLQQPGQPVPPQLEALHHLVYQNITEIQRFNAEEVAKKAGAGMQVGSAQDYERSIQTSFMSAVAFAFDPTIKYLTDNTNPDPAVLKGYKEQVKNFADDPAARDALMTPAVTGAAAEKTETHDDTESLAQSHAEISDSELESDESDDFTADDIVRAMQKGKSELSEAPRGSDESQATADDHDNVAEYNDEEMDAFAKHVGQVLGTPPANDEAYNDQALANTGKPVPPPLNDEEIQKLGSTLRSIDADAEAERRRILQEISGSEALQQELNKINPKAAADAERRRILKEISGSEALQKELDKITPKPANDKTYNEQSQRERSRSGYERVSAAAAAKYDVPMAKNTSEVIYAARHALIDVVKLRKKADAAGNNDDKIKLLDKAQDRLWDARVKTVKALARDPDSKKAQATMNRIDQMEQDLKSRKDIILQDQQQRRPGMR